MVDVWYDAAMRAALSKRDGWGEVQGYHPRRHWRNSLISLLRFTWREVGSAVAVSWATGVLYKSQGSVQPANNFLISNADYVRR
ncbi:hypothetical protein [Bradyrhizobium zhanjiangense]|uniref:hypothetical protein n=1 Tax=Bradyrhizobium zhanjiangense TaxID=1325107 RepID=UPI001FE17496|nr:hypothetical protein [Bradyrhizobium zhanjiangense]